MDGNSFFIDASKVVSETLEGETIVINFQTGTYYSLNETATDIWKCVMAGHDTAAIARHLQERYEGPFDARAVLSEFLTYLAHEGVLEPGTASAPSALPRHDGQKKPFVLPHAKAFKDMQEVLLADPIHDIDATGWPNLKKQ